MCFHFLKKSDNISGTFLLEDWCFTPQLFVDSARFLIYMDLVFQLFVGDLEGWTYKGIFNFPRAQIWIVWGMSHLAGEWALLSTQHIYFKVHYFSLFTFAEAIAFLG